ncbi:MAG: sodium:solute symporter, partial [Actinomycetota bacterium]|nr:sodium:solute symporter [Actinomycetota bacterium]
LQTFPAIVFALYTRWFHRWALFAGWAVGMAYGTYTAVSVQFEPVAPVPFMPDVVGYIALTTFVINVVVAVVVTVVLRALKVPEGPDQTVPEDYKAEAGEEGVEELPQPAV